MTNQQIVDDVEDILPPRLASNVKDLILQAVWRILNDELGTDLNLELED